MLKNQKIKIQIWDTAGHERFRTITTSYYRGAHAIVIVYDVSERNSFEHIDKWLSEIKKFAKENVLMFLVGNKIDLIEKRKVSKDEAEEIANKFNIPYFETSAKTSINIDKLFIDSTITYLEKYNFDKDKEFPWLSLNAIARKKNLRKKDDCC